MTPNLQERCKLLRINSRRLSAISDGLLCRSQAALRHSRVIEESPHVRVEGPRLEPDEKREASRVAYYVGLADIMLRPKSLARLMRT
jgi:hypothetical protein